MIEGVPDHLLLLPIILGLMIGVINNIFFKTKPWCRIIILIIGVVIAEMPLVLS